MILLLAACAPLIAGAPPTPLPYGQTGEIGVTAHGGHVPVHLQDGRNRRQEYPTLGVTAYGRFERDDGFGAGGRLDIGPTQYLAVGGWVRYGFVRSSSSYLGLQLEGGWVYAELSLPAAFRAGERVWLWVRPSARAALVPMGLLPIGTSIELGKTFALNAEVVVMTPILMDGWDRVNPIGATGGLGVSSRF